jgi:cell division protease FtsH
MSELGPLAFGKKEEQIFLGREISQHRDFSEETAIKIDQEVGRIISEQYERAKQILSDNKEAMENLTQALLERETLDSVQIRRIAAGLPLDDDGGSEVGNNDSGTPQKAEDETSKNPFKKPILPPITPNNPATA